MKKVLRRKPSGSMVVAVIALCIAASGTAIAASKLLKGDKLIAKSSLSGNRLRNHTISGKQVNLGKLGKVPSAKNADHATIANSASTATNATHASDASTVGGQPPSAFVPATRLAASSSLIKLTGAASPGTTQTVISTGPFTVTLTCTKTGSTVTESLDASSTEAGSDINGTLEPAGTPNNLDTRGPSAVFADTINTNVDLAAPSGATLDFMYGEGINSLGTDCWIHFFGFH
jgi:hypothetical protein